MNHSYMVDKHRELILEAERHIRKNPETGFKEWETHKYLAEKVEALGYELHPLGDIPGFYADADTGRPGPTVMLIAELDALKVTGHPDANPETFAVHACGHNAQCAIVLGVAAALKEEGALDGLCGKIRLFFLPAEEMVELEWREELRKKGILRYLGGKQELIARGYFDDADICINFHAHCRPGGTSLFTKGNNGFIIKNLTITGKAAHAGAAPHKGINALYAATAVLGAINALRETFQNKDHVGVHPIITSGGNAANVVPDRVVIENQLRAATVDAVLRENRKVNRAVAGSVMAMGANAIYGDRPGYMPLHNDPALSLVGQAAAKEILGEENVKITDIWSGGSTDVGDVCTLKPTICVYIGGAHGGDHSAIYQIVDPEGLCVGGAKVMLRFAELLLENGAKRGKEVMEQFTPVFENKEAYCAAMDSMFKDGEAVTYMDDSSAMANF